MSLTHHLDEVLHINDKNTGNRSTYTAEISKNVRNGDYTTLNDYLHGNSPYDILNSVTEEESRSPLHDACDCESKKLSRDRVDQLIKWYRRNKPPHGNSFVDKQDMLGNTALHYALKRKNKVVVNALLECGADVNLFNNPTKEHPNGEEPITQVYKLYPKTIISFLNGDNNCIDFEENEDDDDDENLKVKCDFKTIIGIGNDKEPIKTYETSMLSNVFRLQKETQVEIFMSPIVQLFMDLKWKRMRWFIYATIITDIIWSLMSSYVIYNLFIAKYGLGANTTEEFERQGNRRLSLFMDYNIFSYFLVILATVFITVKESFDAKLSKKKTMYVTQNLAKLILIGSIYIFFGNVILHILPIWLDYSLPIVAIVASGFLVVEQMSKDPTMGIYSEMFTVSMIEAIWFLLRFSPILIGFATAFHMLVPMKESFQLWPLTGIVKIVAMIAGDITFDYISEGTIAVVKWIKIVVLFFVIPTTALVLANLLVGLVVSNIKELQKKARENVWCAQLQQMNLMEAIIFNNLTLLPKNIEKTCMITKNPPVLTFGEVVLQGKQKLKSITVNRSGISRRKMFYEWLCVFWFACLMIIYLMLVSVLVKSDSHLTPDLENSHIVTVRMKELSKECQCLLRNIRKKRVASPESKMKSD